MMFHISALALIILVLGLAAVRRRSLYSPLVISASIWLIVFIAGLIFEERLYPIQESAFSAWLIWFMVTSIIFFLFYPSCAKVAREETEIRRIPVDYTLPLILLILWLCYRIWIIGSTGPAHFFLNLRLSAMGAEGVATLGFVIVRSYPLIFALFLFEHVYAHRENRHLRVLLWCYMILYAVATMGKLSLLTPVVSWVIIQGIKGRIDITKIALLATVTFVSMMILHFMRAGSPDESTISDVLAIYIYSPLVGLGYIDVDPTLPPGAYLFRFLYAVGFRLGLSPPPVSTISSYVEVPVPTNTFTVIYPFYYDLGMLGIFFGAILYGIVFSCLYFLSVKGKGWALVLYSGYSICLVAQFIGELLIINFSGNVQFLVYTMAIFIVSRRVRHVR